MATLQASVEVNVPVRTAYNQMTQFEQFPRFMEGVLEVRQTDARHLHWHAVRDGMDREWDAEITELVPDVMLAWHSISGRRNAGRVEFVPLAPDKTRISLALELDGDDQDGSPDSVYRRIEQDLARFKKLVEVQELAASTWRSSGGRTAQTVQSALGDGQQDAAAGMNGSSDHPRRRSGTDRRATPRRSMLPRMSEMIGDPVTLVRRMSQEVDHLFERVVGRPLPAVASGNGMPRGVAGTREWSPHVEVAQRDGEVVVSADLPGIRPDDVKVEVRHDRLTIEGERHQQRSWSEQESRRSECVYGHFYREIPLPEGVDPDAAAAEMHDGVLEITVPVRREKRQGRRVDIRAPR